jgi:hypothetical protein
MIQIRDGQTYEDFLERKAQIGTRDGFSPTFMPSAAFDFQESLIEWSVEQGRSGLFADCGLGKSLMQLTWAENVHRHTNRPVLLLTPLAVTTQTVREGEKFGIECRRSMDGKPWKGITVTNYEKLHLFDPSDYAGAVCDESSILKDFNGARRQDITDFMRKMRYRLLCTATAAPNDYHELGTSSEALGYLGYMDMLNRFFKNDQGNSSTGRGYLGKQNEWRLKGHAEDGFWRWVCSWARATRRPSDLGFDDRDFLLPSLVQREHIVETKALPDGMLFALPAVGLKEQQGEVRRSIEERCRKVAELVDHGRPALVWCQLNPEGDLLEKLIPGAVQVSGSDSDERKEERFLAFASGEARVLVTKPKIGAWGLNFQHCNHVTYFPSHSFEQFYQAVRRCWRFGQRSPVTVDVVATEGGRGVLANLQNKAARADRMFDRLVALMNDALHIERSTEFHTNIEVPTWLR